MIAEKINVAVIDDGVNEKYFKNIGDLEHNIEITTYGDIRQRTDYDPYLLSHGTICASIIKKYSPDINLSSIKILDDKTKLSHRNQLISALKWCMHNDIDVINLSLGSSHFEDRLSLKSAVDMLLKMNIIIVAAMNNQDIITYPASFGNIIGVKSCKSQKLSEFEYYYMCIPADGIEIQACSRYMLRNYKGEIYVSNSSNSYATPCITSKVANLLALYGNIELDEIKWHLCLEAKNRDKEIFPHYHREVEWVENAIIFNLNDIMLSSENLRNCIINVKKLININVSRINNAIETIEDYIKSDVNILNSIDTLVLILNLEPEYSEVELEVLCTQLEVHNKNIVLLPKAYRPLALNLPFNSNKARFVYPHAWDRYKGNYITDYSESAPIIAVFNIGQNINLDMISELSNLFKDDGFNCIVSCNESLGLLYGFGFLPSGYKEKNTSIKQYTDDMINFYQADILIMNIHIDYDSIFEIPVYDSYFDYDLKVFFIDEINDKFLNYLNNKSIAVVCNDDICCDELPTKHIFVSKNEGIQNLYKYIRFVFDE